MTTHTNIKKTIMPLKNIIILFFYQKAQRIIKYK